MQQFEYQKFPEPFRDHPVIGNWGAPGGVTKQPRSPNGLAFASTADIHTFGTLADAVKNVTAGKAKGVGYAFFEQFGVAGADFDTIRDPESGRIDPFVLKIMKSIPGYYEISPSGWGVHGYFVCAKPFDSRKLKLPDNGLRRPDIDEETGEQKTKDGQPVFKKPELEFCSHTKFFTVTGWMIDPEGVEPLG